MDTVNTSPDFHAERMDTLRAARIAATVILALASAWVLLSYQAFQLGLMELENLVKGGASALPELSRMLAQYGMNFTYLFLATALASTLYVWVAGRSLSRVIIAATLGAGLCVLFCIVMELAIIQPRMGILHKFAG